MKINPVKKGTRCLNWIKLDFRALKQKPAERKHVGMSCLYPQITHYLQSMTVLNMKYFSLLFFVIIYLKNKLFLDFAESCCVTYFLLCTPNHASCVIAGAPHKPRPSLQPSPSAFLGERQDDPRPVDRYNLSSMSSIE